jgi:hypothetical protein
MQEAQLPPRPSVSWSVQALMGIREPKWNSNRRTQEVVMKTMKVILQGAALFALLSPAAFAQTINQRKENQQDRIGNGVSDGQLTAGETRNLEGKEAGLNHEEHNMRAADNGHLTGADRAKLQHQQNRLSRQIYNKKHNGRVE